MTKKLSIEEKEKLRKCLEKLDSLSSIADVKKQKEMLSEVTSEFADVAVQMNAKASKKEEVADIEAENKSMTIENKSNSVVKYELMRDLFLETSKACIEIQNKCLELNFILLENAPEEYSKTLAKIVTKINDLKKDFRDIMKGVIDTL